MTPWVPDEILTTLNTEGERVRGGEIEERKLAQNDGKKVHPLLPQWGIYKDRIFRIEYK